jgi:parallel beta-helix repeat protein
MNKALGLLAVVALIGAGGCASHRDEREPVYAIPRRALQAELAQPLPPAFRTNIRQTSAIPPLHDGPSEPSAQIAGSTQVFQRARQLNISNTTADAAWAAAPRTVTANRAALSALLNKPRKQLIFKGTKVSELNSFVASAQSAQITVTSRALRADAPLTVRTHDVILDLAGARIEVGPNPPTWLVKIVGARDVAVIGGQLSGGTNGLLVDNASNVGVVGNDMQGLSQNGIAITGRSVNVNVLDNDFEKLGRAAIMLQGPVSQALIANNKIRHLLGHSNWEPGILLTGRPADIATNPDTLMQPDRYWPVNIPITQRRQNPTDNVIMANTIRDGLAAGVYDDGTIANTVVANRIENNSKEGICFDNGATANVLAGNVIAGNGVRLGQSDVYLALDDVLAAGRNPDGAPRAKMPGVSLDNAIYNAVFDNDIHQNAGGGIKLVRTGMFNLVTANDVTDNNVGASPGFHFYGIELGAARQTQPAPDLDFTASVGNIIGNNTIRGPHDSGIFVAAGAVQNELVNNQIVGAQKSAIELQLP